MPRGYTGDLAKWSAPFAHPVEAAYARLLDKNGFVVEAVTPDFSLPTVGLYVECTMT